MKIAILGAGRMGVRHAFGLNSASEVKEIHFIDQNADALNTAKLNCEKKGNFQKYKFFLLNEYCEKKIDAAILATTASQRLINVEYIAKFSPDVLLIEKPLGQSYQQVVSIVDFLEKKHIKAYANLNRRLHEPFIQLQKDLKAFSQFQGPKTITINTGSMGIGANGIHYLDLMMFLLDANKTKILYASIDEKLIPSGRGTQFSDFGGCAVIEFYKNTIYQGKALLSFNPESTIIGRLDIAGLHGQILIDEVEQKRIDTLRKPESNLPVFRYGGDYLPPIEKKFERLVLDDLTFKWFTNYTKGKEILPTIKDSLAVHELLFNWLNQTKNYKTTFPIT